MALTTGTPKLEICGPFGTHRRQIEQIPAIAEVIRITEIQMARAGCQQSNVYLRQLREAFMCPVCWEAQLNSLTNEVPGYNRLGSWLLLTDAHKA